MTFGQRIKKLRLAKEKTQKEVGDFIGVSDRVVGYYEADDRFPKDDTILNKLATYFNVSTDYLLGREEIQTIAAHKDGAFTDEELSEIEAFKKFVLSKREGK